MMALLVLCFSMETIGQTLFPAYQLDRPTSDLVNQTNLGF